jgi:hypothetical protein
MQMHESIYKQEIMEQDRNKFEKYDKWSEKPKDKNFKTPVEAENYLAKISKQLKWENFQKKPILAGIAKWVISWGLAPIGKFLKDGDLKGYNYWSMNTYNTSGDLIQVRPTKNWIEVTYKSDKLWWLVRDKRIVIEKETWRDGGLQVITNESGNRTKEAFDIKSHSSLLREVWGYVSKITGEAQISAIENDEQQEKSNEDPDSLLQSIA